MVRLIRLTDEPDGRVCMHCTYDPDFLALFKSALPWDTRSWEPSRKRWLLTADGVQALLALCQGEQIQVVDARQAAPLRAQEDNPYALMPADLRQSFACLYLAPNAPLCVAEAAHKALARVFHPDRPEGDTQIMERLNTAIATVRQYLIPKDDDLPF